LREIRGLFGSCKTLGFFFGRKGDKGVFGWRENKEGFLYGGTEERGCGRFSMVPRYNEIVEGETWSLFLKWILTV
jgi:hypothetical protein